MPVILNTNFPNQVGASPYTQAYSVQLNFGQMLREVMSWNPNVDSENAGRMINNRYRQIQDRRKWYGNRVRGVASCPSVFSTGTATGTYGNQIVQGVGTAWDPSLVGLQFRNGFTNPWQTIIQVDPTNQTITLDTPYPGTTGTWGYQIAQVYLTFGANIKRLEWAVNQLFGWPMEVNVPVETINFKDTWRQRLGWATVLATRPPTPDGQFQVEVWPTPLSQQSFPFEGYIQQPDMVAEEDAPVAWIRSDVLVLGGIADALLYRPKQNAYYDTSTAVTIAGTKAAQFMKEIEVMENSDESLQQQAVSWDYGCEGAGTGNGDTWAQMHD